MFFAFFVCVREGGGAFLLPFCSLEESFGHGTLLGGSLITLAWLGMAWLGMVWHGMTWHGLAWFGMGPRKHRDFKSHL